MHNLAMQVFFPQSFMFASRRQTTQSLNCRLIKCTLADKQMLNGRRKIGAWFSRLRVRDAAQKSAVVGGGGGGGDGAIQNGGDVEGGERRTSTADVGGAATNVDWSDPDRSDVPVLLVFVILLVRYIGEF